MTAKGRWVDEGMLVLAEQGIDGIRIDRIAIRLGLTKGSFHHHFHGMSDYRTTLLDRYERDSAAAITTTKSQLAGLPPKDALMTLPRHIEFDARLEAGMRGWAFQDDEARAVLERVDASRLNTLVDLWRDVVPDRKRAETAATIPYLIMVGATVALPTPAESEMADVFELLATLVPAVAR